MIQLAVKITTKLDRVYAAIERARRRTFQIVSFNIYKTATLSIKQAEGPSPVGEPPHTHRRAFLRRAIRYHATHLGSVIGPRASVVGAAGEAHEHGGQYGDEFFPQRPFMRPALDANLDRFANEWRGSVFEE